ncbi:MAG TPA: Fic family protein, partial [Elusimicrobia bacterium]|nr:Fic family protein [Elusimicrobiota bacterium]
MLEPKFSISLHLTKLIDEISSLRQRIISAPIQVAWKPTLQKETAIRNAMGSTAIEGFILSLPEVRALASEKRITKKLNMTERAVVNYLAVLRYIQKYADKEFLTNEDICRLHKIIGEGAVEHEPVGTYRTIQNYIVDGIGRVIYTPPPPENVPGLMNEFLEWINNESARYLPVISSGITHYQFVAIHPFVDGNGRVARTLGTWELLRRKFDTLHI